MARPKTFIPLDDIKGLKTLIEEGLNNEQIAKYYTERGINCGRMTISRERKMLSEGDGFIRKSEGDI